MSSGSWTKACIERFMKRNPPEFEGMLDPTIAEEWVSMMEKIFGFVQIEDNEKVTCVAYMLRNDARIWWDVVKRTRDVSVMTWTDFLVEFNAKYYSQAVINSKVVEFTRLQQGSMSVLEYVRRFDQLSRFALDMVPLEASKIWRFLSGLHSGLAGLVDTGIDGLESYADAVGRAVRQEAWVKTETLDVKSDEDQNKNVHSN